MGKNPGFSGNHAAYPTIKHENDNDEKSPSSCLPKMEYLLRSAPPGHLDTLVENLSVLEPVSPELVDTVKAEQTVSNDVCGHPLAAALKEELDVYKSKFYSGKGVEYKFSITGDSKLQLTTLASRIDSTNCHSGSWRGEWEIDTANNKLEGVMIVHAFSHEDCNIQLQHKETVPSCDITDAKSIQNKISRSEASVQAKLEDLHSSMGEKLKSMRRILPVTRTRLDWNVLSHRMVKTLEETTSMK